ncbi:hypothetical protein [Ramlibacter albus]|uniref:Uncharacterized protein n=1 Tax=Ramlibacter albus TaxID=2079448 RepID=A0A923MCF9_9BURK|nr:hypothetical protein [Ramlibacter albus]MBC5766502.1 hypothetical protein [Ramlibacter albus]
MNQEQYLALLRDLAHVACLSDASSLLTSGRIVIGELATLLVHDPRYDPGLLQVRYRLGAVPAELREVVLQALLEANYAAGYGGECVFSLMPESGDAVLTARLALAPSLSAQDLWQSLSDMARHGQEMWQQIRDVAQPPVQGVMQAEEARA